MSGHSHWSSIKHQKGAADAKRGKVFSKLSRQIEIATKEGGKDPEANSKLKIAIDQAKSFNMPKDNIERAIKRGVGELEGEKIEPFVFEAVGPGNSAIIIEGITDNRNRSVSEIKQILSSKNAKMASEGSLRWLFEKKGIILLKEDDRNNEDKELIIIESGAEDIIKAENGLEVRTKPEELEEVKKRLISANIEIEKASLEFRAKETIKIDEKEKDACLKVFEALDENDAVQDIYSNVNI